MNGPVVVRLRKPDDDPQSIYRVGTRWSRIAPSDQAVAFLIDMWELGRTRTEAAERISPTPSDRRRVGYAADAFPAASVAWGEKRPYAPRWKTRGWS